MGIDTTIALISLANAKEHLKITTNIEDGLLGDFVNMVSAMVNSYIGRDLLQGNHTEYYDGNGEDTLMLKHSPVISVTKIYNSTVERIFDSTTELDLNLDVYVTKASGIIQIIPAHGRGIGAFFNGKANLKVVYVGGYTLATVPYDIQLAVRIWLGTVYMKYYNRRYEYISANTGQNSTTFVDKDMPLDVKRILDSYKDKLGVPQFAYKE